MVYNHSTRFQGRDKGVERLGRERVFIQHDGISVAKAGIIKKRLDIGNLVMAEIKIFQIYQICQWPNIGNLIIIQTY